jgi:nucleotide-binding universal stress UspA family protein
LTERAVRRRAAGLGTRLRRRFAARPPLVRLDGTPRAGAARRQIARSPIIVAAVDPAASTGALAEALRATVRLTVAGHPGARLACVGVLKTKVVGLDDYTDGEGRNLHLKSLAALKAWAQPLARALDEGQVTLHVLEASDPAAALVEFARRNGVDQIVMGARAASALRRYLGSVSARVVAEAGCTVTVVRA